MQSTQILAKQASFSVNVTAGLVFSRQSERKKERIQIFLGLAPHRLDEAWNFISHCKDLLK